MSHYVPNSQNMVAVNEARRAALKSSVASTILNSFPTTSRGSSRKKTLQNAAEWRFDGRSFSTTPTPCLLYAPRPASCGQLRFISEIEGGGVFPVGIWCLSLHALLSMSTITQIKFPLRRTLGITGKEDSGCAFIPPPSPTPTQGIKVEPSFLAGSERRRLCCFGLCAPAPVRSGASIAPFTTHRVKGQMNAHEFVRVIRTTYHLTPCLEIHVQRCQAAQRHTVSTVFEVCLHHLTSTQSVIHIHGTFRLCLTCSTNVQLESKRNGQKAPGDRGAHLKTHLKLQNPPVFMPCSHYRTGFVAAVEESFYSETETNLR